MKSVPIVRRSRFPAAGLLSVMLLGAIAGVAAAGCGATHETFTPGYTAGPAAPAAPAASATPAAPAASSGHGAMMAHGVAMGEAEMAAAWVVRPAYVDANGAATSEAYAYALTRPDLLQYMPCYCGCVAMDHRSNLDCFLRPRQAGMAISFEEHASYCVVCVDTALMAKRMLGDGASFAAIRAAVDAEFGDSGAPGTETDLPPS
jgi:hypothetical protein